MAVFSTRRLLSPWISLCLLCIAFFLIWTLGPKLIIYDDTPLHSPLNRAIASSILVLIWFISLLPRAIRPFKDINRLPYQTQQAIELLTQQFQGAIHFLKKTTTTTKLNQQSKNLYDLPWYLFIGPPKSGKTSLLANAGLSFILAKKPKNPDKPLPTEICDWWVSREAVFLDTSGEFCPFERRQLHYKALFSYLLRLIQQEGKHRLNGIVLVLDLPKINQLSRTKQHNMYSNIRANLALIKKHLNLDLPIYLTCNHCDRLVGFQEFFDDLGKDEQQQIWGITLPASQLLRTTELLKQVKTDLSALLMRLHERLLWRLHHERQQQKRLIIKDFPIQMEMATVQIINAIKALCHSRKCTWLRGIYLTSAITNQHAKEDYILPTIKKNMQIPELASADRNMIYDHRSHALFAKHFLQRLLCHDTDLVMQYNQTDLSTTWIRQGALVCAGMIIITLALSWSITLKQHVGEIDQAEKALASYQALLDVSQTVEAKPHLQTPDQIRHALSVILPTLNAAETAMLSLQHRQHHWINSVLHPDNTRYSETSALYYDTLDHLLTPILISLVKASLKDEVTHPSIDFYSTLEVYLMLGEPAHLSREFVEHWLMARWEQLYPNDVAMQTRLTAYTQDWLSQPLKPIDLDENLLTDVKQHMQTRANLHQEEIN